MNERTINGGLKTTALRVLHHVIAHPILALSNGAEWAVRFHDWCEETPTLKIRFLACSAAEDEEREVLHLLRTEPGAREVLYDMARKRGAYYPKTDPVEKETEETDDG